MSQPVILVPLDGSEQALSALPVAKVLGEIERAALHIVYVGEHEPAGEKPRSRLDAKLRCSTASPSRLALERRRQKFCRSRRRSSRD